MRTSLLLIICCALCFTTRAQDSTRIVEADTVSFDTVRVTPYYQQDLRTAATYAVKVDNPALLQLSSGASIFNVLRGRVPGLSISPYFDQASSGAIRAGTTLPLYDTDPILVIDGIAVNDEIGTYLNLNTFDFSTISTFSNTSALNFLGGNNNGAFVLTSKTGEGVERPTIDINSYTTYGWRKADTDTHHEWNIVNAVAFSQDFGAVDTRISYTNQKKFYEPSNDPYFHNLKINTGLVAGDRFDLRLILDGRYGTLDYNTPRSGQPGDNSRNKVARYYGAGNLVARYRVTNWLFASSQVALNSHRLDGEERSVGYERLTDIRNSRKQANFVLDAAKTFGGNISISGFAGIQYVKQTVDSRLFMYRIPDVNERYNSIWEDVNPAILTRFSVDYRKMIILSSHYQINKHSSVVFASDRGDAYNISSAFIFSELMDKSVLSFGKIRLSAGSHTVMPFDSYPLFNTEFTLLPNTKRLPNRVGNMETGVDLGLFDSHLMVIVNYFENEENYDQRASNFVDRYRNKGWEADIRYKAQRSKDLSFESGLVFSRATTSYDDSDDSKPVWQLGLNALLSFRPVVVSMVVESSDGVTGLTIGPNGGIRTVESTFTKLRDISIGYRVPVKSMKEMIVSLSARNLVVISKSEFDWEDLYLSTFFQKSATFNFSMTF